MLEKLINWFQNEKNFQFTLLGIGLVLFVIYLSNLLIYPPVMGFDSANHIQYSMVLSTGRMPTSGDTFMFYNPPVYYLLGVIFMKFIMLFTESSYAAIKSLQLFNIVFAVGTLVYTYLLAGRFFNNNIFKLITLIGLGTLPIFVKNIAMYSPEISCAFFWMGSIYYFFEYLDNKQEKNFWLASLFATLSTLSRMSGVVLFGIFGLYFIIKKRYLRVVDFAVIPLLIAAPFFLYQYITYERFPVFNQLETKKHEFILKRLPAKCYFNTGFKHIFTRPVAENFRRAFVPVIYSGTFGDYRGFFPKRKFIRKELMDDQLSIEKTDQIKAEYDQNQQRYGLLARQNILGFPFFILFIASFWLFPAGSKKQIMAWLIGISYLFYYYFLLKYYPHAGIKATYLLHTFPLAVLMTVGGLNTIYQENQKIFIGILIIGSVYLLSTVYFIIL